MRQNIWVNSCEAPHTATYKQTR